MVIEGLKGRRRFGVGLGGESIAILLAQTAEDLQQLPGGVVREEQGFVEPAFQPGIAVEEPLHGAGVPGDDHHQVLPVVLHTFEKDFNGLPAKVVGTVPRGQGVGFIQE